MRKVQFALVLPLVAAGCSGSSNPLLGTWTTADGDACTTKFVFTEKTEYAENPAVPRLMPASTNLVRVIYAASQDHVVVQNTETGVTADWIIKDRNHAARQDPWKTCNYTRQ